PSPPRRSRRAPRGAPRERAPCAPRSARLRRRRRARRGSRAARPRRRSAPPTPRRRRARTLPSRPARRPPRAPPTATPPSPPSSPTRRSPALLRPRGDAAERLEAPHGSEPHARHAAPAFVGVGERAADRGQRVLAADPPRRLHGGGARERFLLGACGGHRER